MHSDNIFNQPKLRDLKHFFAFDSTIEAIHIGKAIKKFSYKDKLDSSLNRVDNTIRKIQNL